MAFALLYNGKQDKSQLLLNIFISHDRSISITAPASINFVSRTLDLHSNNAPVGETSTSWSETVVVVTASLSPDVLLFSLLFFLAVSVVVVWDTWMHPEGRHPTGRSVWCEYISVVYAPRYFRSDTSIRYLGNFCIPHREERRV